MTVICLVNTKLMGVLDSINGEVATFRLGAGMSDGEMTYGKPMTATVFSLLVARTDEQGTTWYPLTEALEHNEVVL